MNKEECERDGRGIFYDKNKECAKEELRKSMKKVPSLTTDLRADKPSTARFRLKKDTCL
jgi:hypothetical protein